MWGSAFDCKTVAVSEKVDRTKKVNPTTCGCCYFNLPSLVGLQSLCNQIIQIFLLSYTTKQVLLDLPLLVKL